MFEEGQERAQTESTDSEQARQIAAAETTTSVASLKNLQYKNLNLEDAFLGQDAS